VAVFFLSGKKAAFSFVGSRNSQQNSSLAAFNLYYPFWPILDFWHKKRDFCMCQIMRAFLRSESGATAIEYGMIAGLMFLAIVGGVQALGQSIVTTLYNGLISAF
jgi:pilus assembly protein Flp/PilA